MNQDVYKNVTREFILSCLYRDIRAQKCNAILRPR